MRRYIEEIIRKKEMHILGIKRKYGRVKKKKGNRKKKIENRK